ncbi:MAG: Coenzyme F420 hydrogenase/dehydrogenase, beta subunit C-terminal domain [Promethearchaeota archaeon]
MVQNKNNGNLSVKENYKRVKIFGDLYKEVIKGGICIKCGACTSVCDVLEWDSINNIPKLIGKCTLCGDCYNICPVTHYGSNRLSGNYIRLLGGKAMFNELNSQPNMSDLKDLNYQNGGIVSAIIMYLLCEKGFDGAIVTGRGLDDTEASDSDSNPSNRWTPKTYFIKDVHELIEKNIGGTVYAHAQTTKTLIKAIKDGARKIAFVGTPCNIDSVISLLNSGLIESELGNNLKVKDLEIVKIGLFCMEAFKPDKLYSRFSKDNIDLASIQKMEISNNAFKLFAENREIKRYDIKDLEDYIEDSCRFCRDLLAENADIAIGNIGTPDNVNTIITRTSLGDNIIKDMQLHNYIKVWDLDYDNIDEIKAVLNLKDKRAKRRFKKMNMASKTIGEHNVQTNFFVKHHIAEWASEKYNYGFTPILNEELYVKKEYEELVINDGKEGAKNKFGEDSKVIISKIPELEGKDTISYSYSAAYDTTYNLLKDYAKLKGGKVFVKPNNTGFVGIFKNEKLKHILEMNGIDDNADLQPIATQPSVMRGIVDALIDLGVKTIHIGENMLWDGGTPRAFRETGYTKIFAHDKYKNKVFFIDFYENDPPKKFLRRLKLPPTKYMGIEDIDYYDECYPPEALFKEKYDLIYIASVIKTHNCAYYTLATKNFSVSWNPRKQTEDISPRWHIHGLPIEIFHKDTIKKALGEDFQRKYKYLVREAFKYPFKNPDYKERVVKKKSRNIIISNEFSSSGLMNTIKTVKNHYALDVDPHHWSGITMAIMNLGIGVLITRFTRIFATILDELYKQGTRVASYCSGIVAQEKDAPLIYGGRKFAGFSAASFDHVALEKVILDIMFGSNTLSSSNQTSPTVATNQDRSNKNDINNNDQPIDFREFIVQYNKNLMGQYGIKSEFIIDDAKNLWTLKMLQEFIGGQLDYSNIKILMLNYNHSKQDQNARDTIDKIKNGALGYIRQGPPFIFSKSFYVSPISWLKALHTDDMLAMHAFVADKKTIEIPLIPGVVK